MAKKARDIGAEILQGLREIKRGEVGRVINVPAIGKIREKTGLSQKRFAELLGVSVRTLQDWEQGRRTPSGAARTLLMIAAKEDCVSFTRTGNEPGDDTRSIWAAIDIIAYVDLSDAFVTTDRLVSVNQPMDLLKQIEAAMDIAYGVDSDALWRAGPLSLG